MTGQEFYDILAAASQQELDRVNNIMNDLRQSVAIPIVLNPEADPAMIMSVAFMAAAKMANSTGDKLSEAALHVVCFYAARQTPKVLFSGAFTQTEHGIAMGFHGDEDDARETLEGGGEVIDKKTGQHFTKTEDYETRQKDEAEGKIIHFPTSRTVN